MPAGKGVPEPSQSASPTLSPASFSKLLRPLSGFSSKDAPSGRHSLPVPRGMPLVQSLSSQSRSSPLHGLHLLRRLPAATRRRGLLPVHAPALQSACFTSAEDALVREFEPPPEQFFHAERLPLLARRQPQALQRQPHRGILRRNHPFPRTQLQRAKLLSSPRGPGTSVSPP